MRLPKTSGFPVSDLIAPENNVFLKGGLSARSDGGDDPRGDRKPPGTDDLALVSQHPDGDDPGDDRKPNATVSKEDSAPLAFLLDELRGFFEVIGRTIGPSADGVARWLRIDNSLVGVHERVRNIYPIPGLPADRVCDELTVAGDHASAEVTVIYGLANISLLGLSLLAGWPFDKWTIRSPRFRGSSSSGHSTRRSACSHA
jgi:hypothetical protein